MNKIMPRYEKIQTMILSGDPNMFQSWVTIFHTAIGTVAYSAR